MTEQKKEYKRWSEQEDATLARYVKARPQNLHQCFLMVAEQLERTPGAVENRWYGKVSKDPRHLCFFTASQKHVSKNHKNGVGTETNPSIWRRFVNIIRSIGD